MIIARYFPHTPSIVADFDVATGGGRIRTARGYLAIANVKSFV